MNSKNIELKEIYENKISPYLDGSMSPTERLEFEAFVSVNSDFKEKIHEREKELENIKKKIPVILMSKRSRETLEDEIKQSVYNILKIEKRTRWQKIKDFFEEKFSH